MRRGEPLKWWRLLDNVRQKMQDVMDQRQSKLERNIKGQHATPFPLALSILSAALAYKTKPARDLRLLEPAVGLGVFYSCLLELTNGTMPRGALGFEKDIELALFSDALWEKAGLVVKNDDFTCVPPPENDNCRFDLIITNPPYVRHHHLKNNKERLMNLVTLRLGVKPSGLMGLYGYFLLLSHAWMRRDGLGVWLVPREFMDVNYGKVLREYLTGRVELLRVHCFDIEDVQFDDADVSSAVLFFRNTLPRNSHKVLFTFGPSLEKSRRRVSILIESLRDINKWSTIYETDVDEIVKNGQTALHALRIGDLFDVKRGLATGANDFFIVTPSKAKELGIPERFLVPILPSSRRLGNNETIEADDSGMPLVKPLLFLLSCSFPKSKIRKDFPELYSYILKGEERGLHLRHLASKRQPWYKQEMRKPAPILCSYMGRKTACGKAIKFYRNKSQALATNSYLMLQPKPTVLESVENPAIFYDRALEVLNNLDQGKILNEGRSYGGGLYKIEPKELENVVLPSCHQLAILLELRNRKSIQQKLP